MPLPARAALAVLLILTIGAAPPAERVIRVGSIVPATVAGLPAQLLVDPGAPSLVMVSGEMAKRAQLRPGPFAMAWLIGPVRVPGRTAVVRVDLGSGVEKKRIGWTERPYITGVDGAVGPGGLKDDVVRFVLRAAVPGEREHALPLVDGGGVFGGAVGLFAQVEIDGAPVRIRFDLRRRDTMTSAGTALTLARANAGTLAEARRPAEIAFGVERPVRRMTLGRPLAIGPLSLTQIDVRTTDFGNADGIAGEGTAPDPEEVVVTAKGQRDRSRDRITVGADALERCSSITFDKRTKLVRLRCA
ncbi:hypothetical protein [Sphingomonas sp.]|uniref:hypothetical protein n=1 Tax=Sphingomonas sp. TaxID=28214 RepID=UPI002DD65168|nr:hypothetical protein [Sphingomonas sp.]